MHAAEIAADLACGRVVIPMAAGVLSAWGLLVADVRRDAAQTILLQGNEIDLANLRRIYTAMTGRLLDELLASGFKKQQLSQKMAVDVRYAGQAFEVPVELPEEPSFDDAMKKLINERFHANYFRLYGHNDPEAETEWVTLRASLSAAIARPRIPTIERCSQPLEQRQLGSQTMTWHGRTCKAPVYERKALGLGDRFTGPALVVQPDSAIAVPPAVELVVENTGDISLLIGSPSR